MILQLIKHLLQQLFQPVEPQHSQLPFRLQQLVPDQQQFQLPIMIPMKIHIHLPLQVQVRLMPQPLQHLQPRQ